MSEESTSKEEHPEIFKNLGMTHLPVLKIEKLKREEDDEQWISGEELNTDGSSDEKGKSTSTRRRRSKAHIKAKITAKGAIAKDTKVKHTHRKKMLVLSPGGNSGECVNDDQVRLSGGTATISGEGTSKCLEIIDTDLEAISWRPKRGSIKLPTMGKEDTESEEAPTSTAESNEVFLNIIKKVNELQSRFPKRNTTQESGTHVNYSTETESVSNDKAETTFSSNGLLHAFKQIERIDCVVAKNQEARRVEDALRKTIISEEILTQVYSQKNKNFGVTEAVDRGQLLPGDNCHNNKDVPIPTKHAVNNGFDVPLKNEFDTDNLQPSHNLEKNASNPNETQETHNVQEIKPSQHFIKRNIKLATEGHRMGSLATITDEERTQLDCLLEDLDLHEQTLIGEREQGNRAFGDSAYSVCFQSMGSILEIDTKLEKINEERHSRGDRHCLDCGNGTTSCEDAEVDEKRLWKGADAAMNMKRRLNEINRILHNLNEPSKEVEPIEEAQIQELISDFSGKTNRRCSVDSSSTCDELEGLEMTDSMGTDNSHTARQGDGGKLLDEGKLELAEKVLHGDEMKEIVELTKCQMPCFKYRHQENTSEH